MARSKTPSSSKPADKLDVAQMRGELRQLAEMRAKCPPLEEHTAAGLLAQHDDATCRERGTVTRAPLTFNGAMNWARTIDAHRGDPGFSRVRTRWFFDCLTALGILLTGRAVAVNPAEGSALDDVEQSVDKLLDNVKRNIGNAAGSHKTWKAAVEKALTPDPDLDQRISVMKQLSALIAVWLKVPPTDPPSVPPLGAFDIDATTVTALNEAVNALDDAIARRPPPLQFNRDSPAVNAAEGRLYFIMRVLWDDLAEARKAGTSGLQFTVTPTLLRGLNISATKKPKGPPEGSKTG